MLFLLGVFLLFIILGMPVAFSIGVTSLLYLLFNDMVAVTVAQRMIAGIDKFTFLAVPFFILAGNLMNTGGITRRLFGFATSLVGFIPGGLGHANVIASIIFAGMSGAAIADAGGLGTIEIKAMTDEGYDREFSAAVTAASSTIGPIIPPSIPMIIYAAFGGVSVGKLFLAGAVPGLAMGLALMVMIYIISVRRGYPINARPSLRGIWVSFREAFLPLLTPGIILGGIMGGIFTPTEAAVVAAAYALILGMFIYREISWKELNQVILKTAATTTIVLFIVSTASVYGWLLAREQVPQAAARLLFSISTDPYLIMLILLGFLMIVGCFMETTASLIILVPIMAPMVNKLGIDPVLFGVVMVFALMLGLITPPVGVVLYLIADIAEIPFERTVAATAPFLIPLFLVLLVVAFIPEVALWLPNLLMK